MTVIIDKTDGLEFHTCLNFVVQPFRTEFQRLNWLATDLEFLTLDQDTLDPLPQLHEEDNSFVIAGAELLKIIESRQIQFLWGVFSGFEFDISAIQYSKLPYADGNTDIWLHPDLFQLESALIEIVCWDSSATIVKFKDERFAQQFLRERKNSTILEKYIGH